MNNLNIPSILKTKFSLTNRERNFNMYLRTKFAYFKREGLIESSKNGPRYILTSKGRNFLAT